jgi:hypothetical protein
MLFADMRQDHHITALPAAHRATSPPAKSSRCDLQDAAEKLHRPNFFPGIPSHQYCVSTAGQWMKANLTGFGLQRSLTVNVPFTCRPTDCRLF